MEPFAIIAAIAFLALAAYFFFENSGLHKKIVGLDEALREAQSKKPAKTDKPAKAETSSKSEGKKPEPAVAAANLEVERDLDDARSEIKDLKKQIYDLKKGSKDLRQQVKDASEDRVADVPDSDMLFDLREELADLKAENARLEEAAKQARKAPRAEPTPPPRAEPTPAPVAVVTSSGDADVDALRAKYEKELDTLRQEVRELDRKLKSTASNVDKQRRRADNNDRAYKITQRQYDGAQERVELLEAQAKRADFAPATPATPATPAAPAPVAATKPAAPAAPAAPKASAFVPPPRRQVVPAAEVAAPEPAAPAAPKPAAAPVPPVAPPKAATPPAAALKLTPEPKPEPKDEPTSTMQGRAVPTPSSDTELNAFESGGHTAMLTPGALAKSFGGAEEKSEPTAAESGGHTAVMGSAALSKVVAGESAPDDLSAEDSNPRETAERTAILSPGAFTKSDDAETPAKADEPDGGRRPSAGLFGMPDGLLSAPPEEEEDPIRSTQFAFPTQDDDDDVDGGTAKFAPIVDVDLKPALRLGGIGAPQADNPADKPVPDAEADSEGSEARVSGGRLGDVDFGDIGSAIDDAWDDLDMD